MQGVKNGSVGPIRFRLSLFEVRQFTPRLHQLKVSTEKKEKSRCSFNNQSRSGHFTIGLLLNLINTSHLFSCCEQAMLLFYLNLKSSTNKSHMCMRCKLFNTTYTVGNIPKIIVMKIRSEYRAKQCSQNI